MIREQILKDLIHLPQNKFPVTSAYFTLDILPAIERVISLK